MNCAIALDCSLNELLDDSYREWFVFDRQHAAAPPVHAELWRGPTPNDARVTRGVPDRPVYDGKALLDAIAAVCSYAARPNPADPDATPKDWTCISERDFNDARAPAGHPRLPTAAHCARRTGLKWSLLRVEVHDPDHGWRRIRQRRRNPNRPHVLADDAAALRAVARRRGVAWLRRHEYDQTAAEINAERKRAWRHGGKDDLLPSCDQLGWVAWDELHRAAGLDVPSPPKTPNGVSRIDATEQFLIECGFLPTMEVLVSWMKGQDLAMARSETRYSDDIEAWRSRRAERGLWTPPRTLRAPHSTTILEHMDATPTSNLEGPPARRKRWLDEEILHGLVKALDELARLDPPKTFTSRAYKAHVSGRPDLPSMGAIQRLAQRRKTTVEAIRAEAARRAVRG